MTVQSIPLQTFSDKLAVLPQEQQQQVLDFMDFLSQKYRLTRSNSPRILDLNKGEISMSEDFNEPLPDEFWFAE